MKPLDPVTVPLQGRVLVEASAGTGKTYTIATLFVRLVVEEGLRADQILVVTFTKAAASELKDRIRRRLREALTSLAGTGDDAVLVSLIATWDVDRARYYLDRALAEFDLASISTIHGFCQRVLRDHAFESGSDFDMELSTDSNPAQETVAHDLWNRMLHDAEPDLIAAIRDTESEGLVFKGRVLQELVAKSLSASMPVILPKVAPEGHDDRSRRVALAKAVVAAAPEAFDAVRGEGVRFFDDLLTDLRDALEGEGGDQLAQAVRTAMPAALIDEFQDTDPVQYAIFDRIYSTEDSRLFLIGDPKQAIYAFRGADLATYLRAREAVGEQVYTMDTNWRTDQPLVHAVNTVFGHNPEPFIDPGIRFEAVQAHHKTARVRFGTRAVPPLRVTVVHDPASQRQPSSRDIPKMLVDDIVSMLESPLELDRGNDVWTGVEPGDIAVLVDSRYNAQDLYEGLALAGVPAVQYGRSRVVDSDEALELQSLLEALLSPHDTRRVRTALATRLLGCDALHLAALSTHEEALATELDRFREWRTTWERYGIMRTLQDVFRSARVMPRLLAYRGGDRAVTNLRHLAEQLHTQERRGALSPASTARWLRRVRADRGSGGDDLELRLESDSRAVQIVTMHRSKGLEYPVVFCPYLWKQAYLDDVPRFHDPETGADTIDLGSPDFEEHARIHAEEQAAERVRLAYVALTRAKNLCMVYWGRYWGRPQTEWTYGPLSWLLHPTPDGHASHAAAVGRTLPDGRAIMQELQPVRAASEGHISLRLREARDTRQRSWTPPPAEIALGEVRHPRMQPRKDLRIASFTALSSSAHASPDGHDYDAVDAARVPDPHQPEVRLASFPRGAQAGTCVHEVFEHMDFQSDERTEAIVDKTLAKFGIDPTAWTEVLLGALNDICATPLGPENMSLGALPRGVRLDEMGFHMSAGSTESPITVESLANAFERNATPHMAALYGDALRRLAFDDLDGLLKGYIDLVFVHEGRWYLVDYKTNHLGELYDDYDASALNHAMVEGHYVLQYHLYLLALHRYLRARIADYDYDTHIGGARYLFVRGMAPEYGPTRGVFSDLPPRGLIEALDACFGGPT